jgi:hypothetical protein
MTYKAFLGAALLLGACATTADDIDLAAEVGVPFVTSTEVLEWRVLDQDTLFLRGATNEWYRLETMGPCRRLRTGVSIGFVVPPGIDELDRHGALLVEGSRCQLRSVTRVDAPPPEARG